MSARISPHDNWHSHGAHPRSNGLCKRGIIDAVDIRCTTSVVVPDIRLAANYGRKKV